MTRHCNVFTFVFKMTLVGIQAYHIADYSEYSSSIRNRLTYIITIDKIFIMNFLHSVYQDAYFWLVLMLR